MSTTQPAAIITGGTGGHGDSNTAGISPHMGTAERIARINATGTVNICAGAPLKGYRR